MMKKYEFLGKISELLLPNESQLSLGEGYFKKKYRAWQNLRSQIKIQFLVPKCVSPLGKKSCFKRNSNKN